MVNTIEYSDSLKGPLQGTYKDFFEIQTSSSITLKDYILVSRKQHKF